MMRKLPDQEPGMGFQPCPPTIMLLHMASEWSLPNSRQVESNKFTTVKTTESTAGQTPSFAFPQTGSVPT